MYEKLSLNGKIHYTETKLISYQKSVQFWSEKETELRDKYGKFPNSRQCAHIKAIKTYRKEAESELKYWSNELDKLKNKRSIYILFS
jgi:hypothetical protein